MTLLNELFDTVDKQNRLIEELTLKVIEQDEIIDELMEPKATE